MYHRNRCLTAHSLTHCTKEGIAVLLAEQNLRVSLTIADRAYVLDDGAVVYSGTAEALAADE